MARKQAERKQTSKGGSAQHGRTGANKAPSRIGRVRLVLLVFIGAFVVFIVLRMVGVVPGVELDNHTGGPQTVLNSQARLASFFSEPVMRLESEIYRWAQVYGVNPNVLAIVIQIESCGDPVAISSAGALGLMQVMPFHFGNGENMLNPDTNVARGMGVFYECLMQFAGGDLGIALACYNGGPSVTLRDQDTWAAETQYYYHWATGLWDEVVNQRETSDTLKAWLAAGGQRLCDRVNTEDESALSTIYGWSSDGSGAG